MDDKLNYCVLLVLSVSFLFFILLFCIPHKSDKVVIVGEIYGYDDVEYSTVYTLVRRHYVYIFDGEKSYSVINDKLYFTSEKGDTVSLTYSVAWNCFGCLIKKDLVSVEIIESVV